jgi:hypothetical protein
MVVDEESSPKKPEELQKPQKPQKPENATPVDPILEAVKKYNSDFNNSRYSKRFIVRAGKGNIWSVAFIGEDQRWYENYVYELGGELEVFYTLEMLLTRESPKFVPSSRDPDFIRLIVVSTMAIVLLLAITFAAISDSKNPSLQVLSPLLTLVAGYLMGNVPKG